MSKSRFGLPALMSLIRIAGMGGKFVFTLAATKSLTPQEFGRFGLIAAGIWMGVMVAGLEVATVLLRDVVTSEPARARKLRGFYLSYTFVAGLASALIAWTICAGIGYGTWLATLVAVAMFLEYVGQELTRIIVANGHPARGSIAMFCRGGLWCYVLVGGTIVGLAPAKWTLSMVMISWILSDLIVLTMVGVLKPTIDWNPRVFLEILPTIRGLMVRALPFLVSAVGFQALLSGGRFVLAYFDSEALSGRFMLLSTIASINLTLVKGICEQLYFTKVVGNDRLKYWGSFTRSVYTFTAGSTLAAVLAVPVYMRFKGNSLSTTELQSLGLLLVAYVALCLSVISKFQLYSAGKDRALMSCTVLSVLIFAVSAVILTPLFGLNGASLATALGAIALPISQSLAGRNYLKEDLETEGTAYPSGTAVPVLLPTPQPKPSVSS